MNESGEPGFLDKMEDERSAGNFLYKIGFSNIIVAGKGSPVTAGILNADGALSRGLADAPQKTLALFADADGRTVYMGEKERVEGLTTTLGLGPVEVILDDVEHNMPDREYILLSLSERDGRFVFNVCPADAPAEAVPALVDYLRRRHPRSAF